MSSLPPDPLQTWLYDTFGALLLSAFVSLTLYGLIIAQTLQYFRLYPSDLPVLKALVVAIFVSSTLHSVTVILICYHYLVTSYFAATVLFVNAWMMNIFPLWLGTTFFLVQGFYARRMYVVDRRYRSVVALVVTLMLLELSFTIAGTVVSFKGRTFEYLKGFIWMNAVTFGIATSIDVILTGAFVAIIRQSRTGFLGASPPLVLLARYAVFATALLSALAIPAFVCSIVLPNSFVYLGIASSATTVYANSVLAVLNCRKSLPRPGIVTANFDSEIIKLSNLRSPGLAPDCGGNVGVVEAGQATALSDTVLDISGPASIKEDSRQGNDSYSQM